MADEVISIDSLLNYNASKASTSLNFSNFTYEGLRTQLFTKMNENEALLDLVPASTISILIDLIAAIGDFDQYSVESALQENFYDTAKLSNSIFKLSRSLGIRLQRNEPCFVLCDLYRDISDSVFTLPKWTQFNIEGESFFNREPIILNNGVNQLSTKLYQGVVKYQEFISNGSLFQTYSVGDEPFSISDTDVLCWVNDELWTRDLRGLYTYQLAEKKWYENTLSNGLMQAKFGNGVYGKAPEINSTIKFGYINTKGSNAQAPAINLSITSSAYPNIKGTCTSAIQNGSMYKDAYYYQKMGPSLSTVNERAVLIDDYKAILTTYPGIKDAIVRGQAEIAPYRKEWMNVLAITAIYESTWDDAQFQAMIDWLKSEYSMANMDFARIDPTNYGIIVDYDLLCDSGADLNNMISITSNAIVELFAPKIGTLGKGIYKSDIEDAILKVAGKNLKKIRLNSPTVDYVVGKTEYLRLEDLKAKASFLER